MNKKEYIQLSVKKDLSPFPFCYSMKSLTCEIQEIIDDSYDSIIAIFKDNTYYCFFDKKSYERIEKKVFRIVKNDPLFFHKIVKFVRLKGKSFVKWIEQISNKDLKKLSNKSLSDISKLYEKKYKEIYSKYFILLSVENRFVIFLKEILKKKNPSKDISFLFNILTIESRVQFTTKEEISSLNIASKINKNKSLRNTFENDLSKINYLLKKEKELDSAINKHYENFYWITKDYEGKILTKNHFIKKIKKLIKQNPEKKLKEKNKEKNKFKKQKEEIIENLKLSKKEKNYFDCFKEGLYLKELRKKYVSQSIHHYEKVLKEIGRRCKLNLKQTRYVVNKDIPNIFSDKNLQEQIKRRLNTSAFHSNDGKLDILSKEKSLSLYKKFCLASKNNEIKGIFVSPGKVKGKVRILFDPKESAKVKKGDIIVTSQLTPAHSQAIKKASGIICDGGSGITSHVATLAREAKIPCVVRTNIATQVLKDNDLVNIDSEKEIIEKIT
jgi:phosphohistidine swiveling domain-containing protein